MYQSEALARDRIQDTLDYAHESSQARRLAELRRAEHRQQRAERKMISAWQRADALRAMLHAAR